MLEGETAANKEKKEAAAKAEEVDIDPAHHLLIKAPETKPGMPGC